MFAVFDRISSGTSVFLRGLFKIGRYFSSWFGAGGSTPGGAPGTAGGWTPEDVYWAYVTGDVYQEIRYGGLRERINDSMGVSRSADLDGLFNPCARAVDAYKHTLQGQFGKDIWVEQEYQEREVSAELQDAVARVWHDSKFDIELQRLTTYAAGMGRVGMRIVAQDAEVDDNSAVIRPASVWIQIDDARRIKDIRLDGRGNVEWVVLEYQVNEKGAPESAEELDGEGDWHTIREVLTKAAFTKYRDNLLIEEMPNDLGVCPYVLLRHMPDSGTHAGGLPCFHNCLSPMNRLNGEISNLLRHVGLSVRTVWFLAASGDPPRGGIDMGGGMTGVYVKTGPDSPPPTLTPLVPKLDIADAVALAKELMDEIRDRLPELKATDGKFLSHQSGHTVAQLRGPADQLILSARGRYEDALRRAIQLALSWGVLLEMWDLGAGTGTREAADSTFYGGFEDFQFNDRPALPRTEVEKADLSVKDANRWAALATAAQGLVPVIGMDLFREKCLGFSELENQQAETDSTQEDVQQVFPETAGPKALEAGGSGGSKEAA